MCVEGGGCIAVRVKDLRGYFLKHKTPRSLFLEYVNMRPLLL